uniref:Sterile alpha motif domain-containing protein 3 n=1 Tax=Dicentrarchus labrax TaxID=13489 RepID=A0A8P4K3W5_DICLA
MSICTSESRLSDHPLKPKHHYLNHYPELIVQFGPLIHLWTLRFESKDTYFKQCARRLHNFKNLCGTLAERHQLFQSFLSAGTLFPPSVVVEKGTEFIVGDYNDKIRQSVAHLNFDHLNTLISHDVTVKGTTYKSNMFVVVGHNDDGLVVGKIKKAVIHKNSAVFMSSIGDEIKVIILKTLPNLSEDTQKQIITALEISGVESTEDLKYVQQDDLRDLLPVIQQRKLLKAFKMGKYYQYSVFLSRTLKRHQTSRRSGQLQRPTDSYGCTQFQPDPPPEETNETVEQKRQQLVNIYRQEGIQGSERAEVINLMKTTFCLQRNHINQTPAPSIEDLKIQWPYLFTPRGLYCHFELLTDISVLRALELSIEECGQGIEKYLRTKLKNKDVQSEDGELTLCIIQLLMQYFFVYNDCTCNSILNLDTVVHVLQMSATAADVERTLTLPTSPRLILLVAGDGVTLGHWMISIESQVICEGIQKTFITGLAAVFATYYVFNLQYQEEAARTLEFVQSRLIGINPERGRKTSQGKVVSKKTGKLVHKKATTVNPHVATLLKNVMDFEWGFI